MSYYTFCYTSKDKSSWEYCGDYNVPEDKKAVMDFTRNDNVCADYCRPYKDYEVRITLKFSCVDLAKLLACQKLCKIQGVWCASNLANGQKV